MRQTPKTFIADKPGEIPKTFIPDEVKGESTTTSPEEKSFLSRAWEWANKGLISPAIVDALQSVANPQASYYADKMGFKDIGNELTSGMTSPMNMSMMLTGVGEAQAAKAGYQGLTKGLSALRRIGSVPYVTEGISKATDEKGDWKTRGLGALEAIGGMVGVGAKTPKVNLPDEINLREIPTINAENRLLPAMGESTSAPSYIADARGNIESVRDYNPHRVRVEDITDVPPQNPFGRNDQLALPPIGGTSEGFTPSRFTADSRGLIDRSIPGVQEINVNATHGQLPLVDEPIDISNLREYLKVITRKDRLLPERGATTPEVPRFFANPKGIQDRFEPFSPDITPIGKFKQPGTSLTQRELFPEGDIATLGKDAVKETVENRRGAVRAIGEGDNPPKTWNDVRARAEQIIGPEAKTLSPSKLLGKVMLQADAKNPQDPIGQLANSIGRMTRKGETLLYAGLDPDSMNLNDKQKQFAAAIPKFINALFSAKQLRGEQEASYAVERAKRIGEVASITDTGQSGYYKKLGALKGEYGKVRSEPLQLQQPDIDGLHGIINSSDLQVMQKLNAQTGLNKMLMGQIPTDSELRLLTDAFGGSPQVMELFGGLGIIPSKQALTEIATASKSFSSSLDISMAFRQALGAVHTKEYWKSFSSLFKVSDEAFQGVMDSIHANPKYEEALQHGLSITELGTDYTRREEQFMSQLVGQIPGFKQSQRSAVAFLDKLRMDLYSRLTDDAAKAGEEINTVFRAKVANYVNNATGRGSLPNTALTGNMEQNAVMLNNMFFSPRLIASRVKMMNPLTYVNESNNFIRMQYLKSLLGVAAFGTTATQLGKMAAKAAYPDKNVDISADMGSSDFGKLKIDNTRIDPYGGHQQYVVAATRLLQELQEQYGNGGLPVANRQKFGERTGASVLGTFTEQKLSPIASFAITMLRGKDFQNQPADIREETIKRFMPMIAQDLISIYQEDPDLLFPGGVAAATGMGVQSYGGKHDSKPTLMDFFKNPFKK